MEKRGFALAFFFLRIKKSVSFPTNDDSFPDLLQKFFFVL